MLWDISHANPQEDKESICWHTFRIFRRDILVVNRSDRLVNREWRPIHDIDTCKYNSARQLIEAVVMWNNCDRWVQHKSIWPNRVMPKWECPGSLRWTLSRWVDHNYTLFVMTDRLMKHNNYPIVELIWGTSCWSLTALQTIVKDWMHLKFQGSSCHRYERFDIQTHEPLNGRELIRSHQCTPLMTVNHLGEREMAQCYLLETVSCFLPGTSIVIYLFIN
jgi:hypothetical protein